MTGCSDPSPPQHAPQHAVVPSSVDHLSPHLVAAPPILVRLFFQRHAESEWNRIHSLDPNSPLLDDESFIKDAPLSLAGIEQAKLLNGPSLLDTHDGSVVFATSNLRRAALTLLLVFRYPKSVIHILSSLQELSGGLDASSKSEPRGPPALTPGEALGAIFDSEENQGDQVPRNGNKRLAKFCEWLRHWAVDLQASRFVIVGHSVWLSHWFSRYLETPGNAVEVDLTAVHPKTGRRKRLGNAGIIAMDILIDAVGTRCHIVPGSTLLVTKEVKIDYNS